MTDRQDNRDDERGHSSLRSIFEAKTVLFIVGMTILFISLGLLLQ